MLPAHGPVSVVAYAPKGERMLAAGSDKRIRIYSAGGHLERSPQRLLDRALSRFGAYQLVRPLVIGIVHGLAGSAAVALLVLATIHNPVWAIGYLLLFGIGTIAGMMLITVLIAAPSAFAARRFGSVQRYLRLASGVVSIVFGLFLAHQIGVVDGLFSATPTWTAK